MLRTESGSKEEPQKRQLVLGLVLHQCYIGKGRGVEGGGREGGGGGVSPRKDAISKTNREGC